MVERDGGGGGGGVKLFQMYFFSLQKGSDADIFLSILRLNSIWPPTLVYSSIIQFPAPAVGLFFVQLINFLSITTNKCNFFSIDEFFTVHL